MTAPLGAAPKAALDDGLALGALRRERQRHHVAEVARVRIGDADQHLFEIHLHLRGRLVAARGIHLERAHADRVEARRQFVGPHGQRRHRPSRRKAPDDLHLRPLVPHPAQASISHSITPTAKTSARRSTLSPRSLLGRHVGQLALERAGRVWCDAASAFATPKSTSLTWPSYVTNTFCGLTSRWTTPSGLPSRSVSV